MKATVSATHCRADRSVVVGGSLNKINAFSGRQRQIHSQHIKHVVAKAENATSQSTSPVDTATQSENQASSSEHSRLQLQVSLARKITDVNQADWNACCGPDNPFVSYEFLRALEESGSVTASTGWMPQHLLVKDANTNELLACAPLYLKMHSYGEYVFDNSWADAHDRMSRGKPWYYPKLQSCVPFTPATGPRILVKPGPQSQEVLAAAGRGLMQVAQELGVSGVHVTFNTHTEAAVMENQGFKTRFGMQYHWSNGVNMPDGELYKTFDDFLGALQQRKRKSIRQERKKVKSDGWEVKCLTGLELEDESVWDAFYEFYLDTAERRWGHPYLTREFFSALGSSDLHDRVMLAVAYDPLSSKRKPVAAALNLIGSDTLFGRNWGIKPGLANRQEAKGLHFELCYYSAIEWAIERGFKTVEAGAQGEHKLQRGYLPSITYSSHYLTNPGFALAVENFLKEERSEIRRYAALLTAEASPYKIE